MYMTFLNRPERTFLENISRLGYCNPFLPERVALERAVLGAGFAEGEPVWSQPVDQPERPRANAWRIAERVERVAGDLRVRLARGAEAGERELALYEDAVLLLLYQRYYPRFLEASFGGLLYCHERSGHAASAIL